MSTPAILPSAMICLVALAAAHDRRHAAMAAWFGMALALSGWSLIAAPVLLAFAIRGRCPIEAIPIAIMTSAGASLALQAAGLPHSAAGSIGVAAVLILAAAALAWLAWLHLRSAPLSSSRAAVIDRARRQGAPIATLA